ncbi:MAG TPA: hypothetical protein VKZ51_12660, partial [Cyclobacteriaceae bacterium]|nr:hypothetical protein [Cyclobacteriaceae bacterium]
MMNRLITVFLLFLFPLGSVFAQTSVEGTVTGDNGSPLEGVSVVEKGTSNWDITDASGRYSVTVGDNASLI